jgi:hypothetical protein
MGKKNYGSERKENGHRKKDERQKNRIYIYKINFTAGFVKPTNMFVNTLTLLIKRIKIPKRPGKVEYGDSLKLSLIRLFT